MLRIITIVLLCFVVVNLFIGLYHLLRDRGQSAKMVRALTIRVALAVLLFAVIIIASHFGAAQEIDAPPPTAVLIPPILPAAA